ncbi:MAG: type III pantothenate kinase [Clostridia bacterium]|nr:type III pantothenate kinase [Clostridia bacterium]MBQ9482008.1 type III pantothenate kinase [Clostridia bacterium]
MLLVIDVGNTNIKYGVFDGNDLRASFRVTSAKGKTADEYGAILMNLLSSCGLSAADIDGAILSSVIPALNYTVCHMCEYFLGMKPLVVGPGIKTGLDLRVSNSREVGADRIVNSVAAYRKYGGPCVVIDFGTATTFNVITADGKLIGGVISPGIKGSLDSLVHGTAQLPDIELEFPGKVVCTDTVTNMQAGLLYGFTGLVEYIVKKIKAEINRPDAKVIATGGLGQFISKETECIDVVDRRLTLEGLKMLYDLNRE